MHKYQPRIHIVKQEKSRDDKMNISLDQKISDRFSTHIFPETQFMAVTAYQNQQVRGCLLPRRGCICCLCGIS